MSEGDLVIAKRPFHKKALEFVKDWGGIATVSIAVAYTFPFSVIERYLSWTEYSVSETRKALTDASALIADSVMNSAKIADWQTRAFVSDTYNSRIYNILVTHLTTFESAKKKLSHSELLTLAAILSLAGLATDALPYYEAAITKATETKNTAALVNIYRGKGSALFTPGPVFDLDAARTAYQEVFNRIPKTTDLQSQSTYLMFLTELAAFELKQGDWKCGQIIYKEAKEPLQILATVDQNASGMYQLFETQYALMTQQPNQTADGCKVKYDVPRPLITVAPREGTRATASGLLPGDGHQLQPATAPRSTVFDRLPLQAPEAAPSVSKTKSPTQGGPAPTPGTMRQ
jgi:tetratricopeptide (TPR) repeat protein